MYNRVNGTLYAKYLYTGIVIAILFSSKICLGQGKEYRSVTLELLRKIEVLEANYKSEGGIDRLQNDRIKMLEEQIGGLLDKHEGVILSWYSIITIVSFSVFFTVFFAFILRFAYCQASHNNHEYLRRS